MLNLDLKAEGLQPIVQKMKALEAMVNGSLYQAVELNSKQRIDYDEPTNAEILQYLAEQGRNFTEMDASELDEIAQAFVDKIEEFMSKVEAAEKGKDQMKAARNTAANSWKAAMLEDMRLVTEHIEEGRFTGGGNKDLSPAYARFKQAAVGFTHPIGKFHGELIDNLNPKGPASRNIRVKTK